MVKANIDYFIGKYVTKRTESMFKADIDTNHTKLFEEINNKSILVIGGAGTIGTSFIKSILKFKPKKLVVFDINENGLTELTRSLRSDINIKLPETYTTYPISFQSNLFYKYLKENPDFNIVANFAAHKHVRSEKDFYSIQAMIENNVLSNYKLLEFLKNSPPSHFFCVSTDKATNPVNIMGASKKIMEQLLLSYSKFFKITTARFANVAFSNGSLLDGYLNRINSNQAIACPENIKRFFVSPTESGEICLLACILGKSGNIYFPKLNQDNLISFKEITHDFFKYLNLTIESCETEEEAKSKKISSKSDYPIYFFKSNTDGEKLFEEFYSTDDIINIHDFKSLGYIETKYKLDIIDINKIIKKLEDLYYHNSNKKDIVNILSEIIPDFNHIETGKNLDQKM